MTAMFIPSFETGVFLGLNAIENAFMLVNSPKCSFVRGLKVFLHNDLMSTVYRDDGSNRLLTTEWMGLEDVIGTEERLVELVSQLPPGDDNWLFLFQNVSSLASGFDLAGLAGSGPAVVVEGPRLDEDFLGGYDTMLAAVMANLLDPAGKEVDLLIAGHLFCRNEADERANVDELNRLLDDFGLGDISILLSGGRLGREKIWPLHVALMPYAGARCRRLLKSRGLEWKDLPLPIGFAKTSAWLQAVASMYGLSPNLEEAWPQDERRADVAHAVSEHLAGTRALVVGDPPLASSVAAFLGELAVTVLGVVDVGITPTDYGRYRRVAPAAEDFHEFVEGYRPELIIGSGDFSSLAEEMGIAHLEIGFPSYHTHYLTPRPYLGPGGATRLIEDMLNAFLGRNCV